MTAPAITTVHGVGNELAKKFEKLGIETVHDLLQFYPRKYNDYSKITPIKGLKVGQVTIKVQLRGIVKKRGKRGISITEGIAEDASGTVGIVWFNQPWIAQQIKAKQEYYLSGELAFQYGRYSIANPVLEPVSAVPTKTAKIVPVYRETKGLTSYQIHKVVKNAFDFAKDVPDDLPEWMVKQQHYMTKARAICALHAPQTMDELRDAQAREAFTEIFALSLAGSMNRVYDESLRSPEISFAEEEIIAFVQKLPFTLTNAQKKVIWTAIKECNRSVPMNRLIEGDVGSGKTVVATIAAYNAVLAGYQVAIIAPTEILARQHANELAEVLPNVRVELLTGARTAKQKRESKEALQNGDIDIAVGTHALLQKDVLFHKLGLLVIDEQHRFGVDQRQALLKQTHNMMPHVLTMTATPIPRSLALTLYGELSLSVMNELPPGRKPVKTAIVSPNSREQMYSHIKEEIAKGRQAFIVYPLITDSDTLTAKSIERDTEHIQKVFGKDRVAVLHGKMKSADKEAIMQGFSDKKYDLMVGTTVIEVGVNIPNASIIVIEGAERFGLAQLHQLRGRVARASHQSYCYVVPSQSLKPPQRLYEFERSTDGFALAEYDLEARGPGAIYGKRQSGALELDLASLNDKKLIERSQELAQEFIQRGENLVQYPRLHTLVNTYIKLTKLN